MEREDKVIEQAGAESHVIRGEDDKKEVLAGVVEDYRVIKLRDPIKYEGETYKSVDLTRLEDLKAADMVDISRRMTRNGDVGLNPELSLEYALNVANIVTGIPLEFFDQLPPYAAIAIKSRVTNFLYRGE